MQNGSTARIGNRNGRPDGPDIANASSLLKAKTILKRISLLNGVCGEASHLVIRGQVADVALFPGESSLWDPLLTMPTSMADWIHPLVDLGMKRVRRPHLRIQILNHSGRNATTRDLEEAEILYISPLFKGDDYGFFSYSIRTILPPGHYTVRILFYRVDSFIQRVKDIRLPSGFRTLDHHPLPIGFGKIRILPGDYTGNILTSDIDQTFLDTDIRSQKGLLDTLFETPSEKRPLPGMASLYRAMRKDRNDPIPLLFISASPHFFRRTFQALFRLHEIDYTGLSLKFFRQALESLPGRAIEALVRPGMPARLLGPIMDLAIEKYGFQKKFLMRQVRYKLAILLENRLSQPTGAREILMGDNTESDYLTFSLYRHIVSGRLKGETLRLHLQNMEFRGTRFRPEEDLNEILELSHRCIERHGSVDSVERIWIHMAYPSPDASEISAILARSLPDGRTDSFVSCRGGAGMALAAFDAGLIGKEDLKTIFVEWKEAEAKENRTGQTTLCRDVVLGFPFLSILKKRTAKRIAAICDR